MVGGIETYDDRRKQNQKISLLNLSYLMVVYFTFIYLSVEHDYDLIIGEPFQVMITQSPITNDHI